MRKLFIWKVKLFISLILALFAMSNIACRARRPVNCYLFCIDNVTLKVRVLGAISRRQLGSALILIAASVIRFFFVLYVHEHFPLADDALDLQRHRHEATVWNIARNNALRICSAINKSILYYMCVALSLVPSETVN